MKYILYLHAIIEVIGGVVFYTAPYFILEMGNDQSLLFMTKIYGIMAVILGVVSMEIARSWEYHPLYKRIYLVLMGMHVLIGFSCYGFYQAGVISLGGVITHLGFSVLMMVMYFKDLPHFGSHK